MIIPFYNEGINAYLEVEQACIVLEKINKDYIIIAVDDGSSDGVSEKIKAISKDKNVELITHPKNLGLGAAIRSGIKKALEYSRVDIIVTKDSDMTQDMETVKEMIYLIDNGRYDIIIASRYIAGSAQEKLGLIRRLLTIFGNSLFRSLIKYPNLTDNTCNYRAYRSSLMVTLRDKYGGNLIEEDGFSSSTEILLKLLNFKPKVAEVPLILDYGKKIGKSKMNLLLNSSKVLKLLFSFWLRQGNFKRNN